MEGTNAVHSVRYYISFVKGRLQSPGRKPLLSQFQGEVPKSSPADTRKEPQLLLERLTVTLY